MTKLFSLLFLVVLLSCKSTTYYISRHAERAGAMSNDPALSPEGEKQAQDLKNYLQGKKIKAIYSTNYIRTKSTAQPTSELFGVPVKIYNPAQHNVLIDSLKAFNNVNVLVIGHSNTVDDIVNGLTGATTMGDLAESEYGNLFIVKKKGSSYSYERIKVPQTAPR